jgi:hypothetical protein
MNVFLYKLKILLKTKKSELLSGSIQFSFMMTFLSFLFIFIIRHTDFSNRERWQLLFITLFFSTANIFSIYLIISFFSLNIFIAILFGLLINFGLFLFPGFIIFLILEMDNLHLTKAELRQVKLNAVLKKFF